MVRSYLNIPQFLMDWGVLSVIFFLCISYKQVHRQDSWWKPTFTIHPPPPPQMEVESFGRYWYSHQALEKWGIVCHVNTISCLCPAETDKSDNGIFIQVPNRNYRITQWYLTCTGDCGKSHICCSANVTHKKLKTRPGTKQMGDDITIIKTGTASNYKNSLSAKKTNSPFNTTVLQALCGSPCWKFWNPTLLCKASKKFLKENGEVLPRLKFHFREHLCLHKIYRLLTHALIYTVSY